MWAPLPTCRLIVQSPCVIVSGYEPCIRGKETRTSTAGRPRGRAWPGGRFRDPNALSPASSPCTWGEDFLGSYASVKSTAGFRKHFPHRAESFTVRLRHLPFWPPGPRCPVSSWGLGKRHRVRLGVERAAAPAPRARHRAAWAPPALALLRGPPRLAAGPRRRQPVRCGDRPSAGDSPAPPPTRPPRFTGFLSFTH